MTYDLFLTVDVLVVGDGEILFQEVVAHALRLGDPVVRERVKQRSNGWVSGWVRGCVSVSEGIEGL